MSEWFRSSSAVVLFVCSAVLCLEMTGLAFATPLLRTKRNVWRNEEDAERFSGTVADVEHRDVARVIRAHRNQLENFAPFFALGLAWVLLGGPGALGPVLFVVFTAARTAYLVFFLTKAGKARTASHTVSFLVLVTLACLVIWRSLAYS